MANEIRNAIKRTVVDAGGALKRAGEAIVDPSRLGAGALTAFKTLRFLDSLTALLPKGMQPLAKALLDLGIKNVGQHGDPVAKEAARGFVAMTAIKERRVDASVIDRAVGAQQRQALIDASLAGDVATAKSILRHTKKVATQGPPTPAPSTTTSAPRTPAGAAETHVGGAEPTKQTGATEVPFEQRLMDFMKGLEKKYEGELVADMAAGLGQASWRSNGSAFHIELKGGSTIDLEIVGRKGKLVLEGAVSGRKLSPSHAADFARMVRDAAVKHHGASHLPNDLALAMSSLRSAAGVHDETDATLRAADEARRAHTTRDARQSIQLADGSEYRFDLTKEPGKISRFDQAGHETTLTSAADFRDVANKLDAVINETRKRLGERGVSRELREGLTTHLTQLEAQRDELLAQAARSARE